MPLSLHAHSDGVYASAYPGDGAILLAFDVDDAAADNLAGFAVHCTAPRKGPFPTAEHWLKNPISLGKELNRDLELTSDEQRGTNLDPLQTFHWVHFPSAGPGNYIYRIHAAHFANGQVRLGPSISIEARLSFKSFKGVEVGFTRGYVSSQAYANWFGNAAIEPAKRPIVFDTSEFERQYRWLGAHARRLVFYFLKEIEEDVDLGLDMFAFDFDEPDIVDSLSRIGPRASLFIDDHDLKGSNLGKAAKLKKDAINILQSRGVKVKKGHFGRFQHNKVMIQKDATGKAIKVLTGSANFSLRGMYVQANSILVFDDDGIAGLYEEAFRQASDGLSKFKSSHISSRWHVAEKNDETPRLFVSFAPHQEAFPLDKVSDAIRSAKSSVLFSIMGMSGKGPVIPSIKHLRGEDNIFSLGSTQSSAGLQLFRPGLDNNQAIVPFAYLKDKVPAPFKKEWSGGAGMSVHHKYVVCDFNDAAPVVFCGSSNLAAGGEESNTDNLIAIHDRGIATLYAVEAIRLFDHYRFRSLHNLSTSSRPLVLASDDSWATRYFDPKNIKFRERKLLSSK